MQLFKPSTTTTISSVCLLPCFQIITGNLIYSSKLFLLCKFHTRLSCGYQPRPTVNCSLVCLQISLWKFANCQISQHITIKHCKVYNMMVYY